MSEEEAAWDKFWKAVDCLRDVLRERGMEFSVQWAMVARSKPKKPQSDQAASGGVEHG